jgi:putative endonuclease
MERYELGIFGENLAAEALLARGYVIVERRYRTEQGEIDIVALEGETIVFVEVRAKATPEFGTAAESVTRDKQRRVVRVAREYLSRHNLLDRSCRFDVVAIDDACSGHPALTIYAGAFDAV